MSAGRCGGDMSTPQKHLPTRHYPKTTPDNRLIELERSLRSDPLEAGRSGSSAPGWPWSLAGRRVAVPVKTSGVSGQDSLSVRPGGGTASGLIPGINPDSRERRFALRFSYTSTGAPSLSRAMKSSGSAQTPSGRLPVSVSSPVAARTWRWARASG